ARRRRTASPASSRSSKIGPSADATACRSSRFRRERTRATSRRRVFGRTESAMTIETILKRDCTEAAPSAQPNNALDFELPPDLEAREPPEARGMARDE